MSYIIVEGSEPLLLHERVNQMMAHGYIPTGGLAVYVFNGDQRGIYQAMIRAPQRVMCDVKLTPDGPT